MLHNAFVFIAGGKDAWGNGEDRSPLAVRLAQRRNRRNYGTNRSQQTPSRLVFNCQFPFMSNWVSFMSYYEWKIALLLLRLSIHRKTFVWNFHSIFFQFDPLKGRKPIIYATRSWSLEKSERKIVDRLNTRLKIDENLFFKRLLKNVLIFFNLSTKERRI